jgi:hypothetical protein
VAGELDGLPGTGGADPNHERRAPADHPSYLLDEALAFLASEVATLYRNLHPSGRKRHELVNISGREQ